MNPTPAAGVILMDGNSVLLVKRKYEPRVGMWTLPAGFVEADENVAECVVREAKEETNLDIEIVRIFNVYSAFDDPRTAVVLIIYIGKKLDGELRCGDDASEARYFELDGLPEDIAFRAHKNALRDLKAMHEAGSI
jgi:8-oxo-dGTP diphosphatase